MQSKRLPPSTLRIFLFSLLASCCVLVASLVIQWFIYDDWLHEAGPLRIVGTSIAATITFVFVLRWQHAVREREREMVRRFKKILHMNDRIRNALQAIECVTYLSEPKATEAVRQSVDVIDSVLREVLEDSIPATGSIDAARASATNANRNLA